MVNPHVGVDDIKPTYGKGIPHAITICPDDTAQRYDEADSYRRANEVSVWLRDKLDRYLAPYADYCLYTEISKPEKIHAQSRPRVHFHGFVTFRAPVAFRSDAAHKLTHAIVEIKSITDNAIWTDYCTKDAVEMREYMGRDAVISYDKAKDTVPLVYGKPDIAKLPPAGSSKRLKK